MASEHDPSTGAFVDATTALRDACRQLQTGQIVSVPNLNFMDAMGAVQILDPRMDGGMVPVPAQITAACDRWPETSEKDVTFDVCAPLSAKDVLWIIDRTMACEAAWLESASLSSASLSQTVYTCLYVHHLARLHPNVPDAPDATVPPQIARRILRPYLMGLLKCAGLVWDELVKGNLIDGEDFNGDKSGVSLLESIDARSISLTLNEAIEWTMDPLNIFVGETADRMALRERLLFRKSLLDSLHLTSALMTANGIQHDDVHVQLEQASANLESLSSACSPAMASASSDAARASFDPWFSRHFSSVLNNTYTPLSLAPPQPLMLPVPAVWRQTYRRILAGMHDFIRIVYRLPRWTQWKRLFDQKALEFQRSPSMPFVRSLRQTAIINSQPYRLVAEGFLYDVALIDVQSVRAALQSADAPSDDRERLDKRLGWFLDRLASQLVAHLCSLAQNRSRSKRRLARSYADLLSLGDEASAVGHDLSRMLGDGHAWHPDLLYAAQRTLTLDAMLHCVLCGIEIELYRADELQTVYWMARRVAQEACDVWAGLSRWSPQGKHAEMQASWFSVLSQASQAFDLLYYVDSRRQSDRFAWMDAFPKSAKADTAAEVGKVMFARRFKWLNVRQRPQSAQDLHNLWQTFRADLDTLKAMPKAERLRSAGTLLEDARRQCQSLNSHGDDAVVERSTLAELQASFERIRAAIASGQMDADHLPLSFEPCEGYVWFPSPVEASDA